MKTIHRHRRLLLTTSIVFILYAIIVTVLARYWLTGFGLPGGAALAVFSGLLMLGGLAIFGWAWIWAEQTRRKGWQDLSGQINKIADAKAERLDLIEGDDEIAALTHAINAMLDGQEVLLTYRIEQEYGDRVNRLLVQQQQLKQLNETTQVALYAPDIKWMINRAADLFRETLKADACLILIGEQIGKTNSEPPEAAVSGDEGERLQQLAMAPDFLVAIGAGIDPHDCASIAEIKSSSFQELAQTTDFRSFFCVPLEAAQLRLGLALLFFDQQRLLSDDEHTLINQIADQVALGMLKNRALSDAQARLIEAETLRQASGLITATLQPDEAIDRILEQLRTVVPYDSACVQLLEQGQLVIVGGHGWDEPTTVIGMRFPVPGDNPNTAVIQEQAPKILNNAPEAYPSFRRPPHDHIVSWLGAPLIVHGRVIGMLAIDKKEPGFYKPAHVLKVTAFADQVAISLENARLFESEHRRALELEALRATVADIIAERDLPNLLLSIVERASALLDATGGELGLIEEDPDRLHLVISLNLGTGAPDRWIWRGEGAMGEVARTLTPLVVEDYQTWEGRIESSEYSRLRACLAAPLMVGGRLLGVIGVGDEDPNHRFNQSDLTLLNLFAQQAAIAVENARLFEEIRTQSVTDDLTGLYNRRGLFDLGKIEVERAIRYQRPLSVILFDIDHFKLVNDRFSHAVGDKVLRQLAELCRRIVRASDIVGRYGGEEFAVILPETRLEEAQQVAERFRLAAEQMTILLGKTPTRGGLQVTISCGVMCAENEIPELAVLLDRADTALYNAKLAGRNRTETFPVKQPILDE